MTHPSSITVGSFPYSPGFNPYQTLFTQALESTGLTVRRIPPSKWFPLSKACAEPVDVLHLDWHHDWYRGKNRTTQVLKTLMYRHGLRRCRRLPVVWTAHNLHSHDTENPAWDKQCTQELINVCRGIMVMSEASETLLRCEYTIPEQTRVEKVYHGHYIDCYPNEIPRAEARRQLCLGDDEFTYLALGSCKPYKGYVELIEAFASIATATDRLVIAGSASNQEYLNQMQAAADQATRERPELKIDLHLRTITDQEMQVFFNAADVCVLPFKQILNSGSLLLAMSFGKPVVAPALGSIPEIAHPESYFGYEPEDTAGLACQMTQARESAATTPDTTWITEFTREKYSWQKVGTQLKALYSDLLQA